MSVTVHLLNVTNVLTTLVVSSAPVTEGLNSTDKDAKVTLLQLYVTGSQYSLN